MTIRHLKIFLQVYRHQSITRAAESLHMTQPAVSVAIKELEHRYGVVLFQRLGRKLYITDQGRELYARAVHIVEEFHQMEQGMGRGGSLRVGSSVTLGNFLMPGLAARWAEACPDIPLQVTVANGGTLQQMLCDDQLDLALIEGPVERPELEGKVFRRDSLILVLPKGHHLAGQEAITLQEAAALPLLLREKGSAGRAFVDATFARHGLTARPTWESIDTGALLRAVEQGLGCAFLPRELAQNVPGTVTRELADEPFLRENVLVWHKHKRITPTLKSWIALVEGCVL